MNEAATPLTAALRGRRAFISGGGSGLGLAFATLLARDGWQLGLLDRDPARLAALTAPLGAAGAAAVHGYHADVTDDAAFAAAVGDFAARTGGLELMINSAGVAVAGEFAATPAADWRWALEINVVGVATGCRVALPFLLKSPAACILNIASAAAFASAPQMAAYSASKAAVVSLTETLAHELGGTNVHAAVAMPGFIATRLLDTARAPAKALAAAGRLMTASRYSAAQAAADMLAACAARRRHIVVPRAYARLWYLQRVLPGVFAWLTRRAHMRALAHRRSAP